MNEEQQHLSGDRAARPSAWLRPCAKGLRCAVALALIGCAAPLVPPADSRAPAGAVQPEGASGLQRKPGWQFARAAVAAAHPLAAEAGWRVLKAGGNALDAAIAVQMVLALVEPQSSGIGGGAFLMHWDGREVAAWDGRETAPAAADERLFMQPDGKPMPMAQAVSGGLAVGVPGAVRMLEAAHRVHGRLPWARLFEPAIDLAERGFPVGQRLHTLLATEAASGTLAADAQARAYFFAADGRPHAVGHLLRNPALAEVLRAIAARGSAALHEGPIAADLAARVRGHAARPGRLAAADLAGYVPLRRAPICTDWLAAYRVCGFPPPSSGHLTLMQILGLLEKLPRRDAAGTAGTAGTGLVEGIPGADWLHAYTEAARLAFADRDQYIADPAFAAAPGGDWRSLLDGAYLARRAALVGELSAGRRLPGQPGSPGTAPIAWAPMPPQPEGGTSHVSVVDAEGHALALTTSIEAVFGARLMADGGTGLAGGYLLNNQLTDFSFTPADASGRPVANRVQAGKRPRSSMSPTLVFEAGSGRLLMTLGSPGGAAIIHYAAKALVGSLQWGLDAQRAIDLPNFAAFNGPATVLEAGRFPAATAAALRARGHTVAESELTSGAQALQRTASGWHGAADPRREGVVVGE
ncbi:MAG: gamma-glutamyltransferase family protein [Burkholderiales bacterium]|nr:gamma-glutamyltransferase family protein [Burkholderiales bacterium]